MHATTAHKLRISELLRQFNKLTRSFGVPLCLVFCCLLIDSVIFTRAFPGPERTGVIRRMLELTNSGIVDWRDYMFTTVLIFTVSLAALFVGLREGVFFRVLTSFERRYGKIRGGVSFIFPFVHVTFFLIIVGLCRFHFINEAFYRYNLWLPQRFMLLTCTVLSLGALGLYLVSSWHWARQVMPKVAIAFLIALVGTIAASYLSYHIWPLLSDMTMVGANFILHFFFSNTQLDLANKTISIGAFRNQVFEPCSGFEGIGLYVFFLSVFIAAYRDELRFPRVYLLFPLGVLAIFISNIVRIAGLMAIAAKISEAAAMGGFHSFAGWIFFIAIAIGAASVALHTSFFSKRPRRFEGFSNNATAPYLLPLAALLAVQFLSGAFPFAFDYLYPLRVLVVLSILWIFRSQYRFEKLEGFPFAANALGILTFAIWLSLEPVRWGNPSPPWLILAPVARYGWLVFRAIGSIITVPIVEELAFRGYLMRRLISEDFDSVPIGTFSWFSFIVSSVAFGILHSRPLAGILAGLFFAAALYARKRLSDAIVAHMVANALLTIYALSTGEWRAWS